MFEHLYVLNGRKHSILRVDAADGTVESVTDQTGYLPDGIVTTPDRIYWTTMGKPTRAAVTVGTSPDDEWDFSAPNGSVRTCALDGTGQTQLVPDGTITTGKQLTADFDAALLYFCDREGTTVYRVATDGTGLTPLVHNTRDDTWTQECVGVAADPVGGFLYWTQKGPSKGGRGKILRAGLDLPEGETASTRTDIEVLWHDLPEPIDLHLDLDTNTVFWTDRGAAPDGNTLNRAAIPDKGHAGATPEILAYGFDEAIGLAVDTDAGLVYVSDLGGSIRSVEIGRDHAVREIVHLPDSSFTGIAGL
ncbi:hypothetical protein [Gordonia sp. 852002-10350_SCH5691597]|uniref:hypothetical protein n=1 Tax=Gordonia sp. 852002-10350_SCH5691597 TaxID=1834085 RepID=UPI0007EB9E9E|nr:hypothetical protein [Gordonia sp. 852002-10350_SCH5691597]OBA67330.1 hypothetical protein A5777_17320 [Gordonia sp. 852002-10350_SCH5691597]